MTDYEHDPTQWQMARALLNEGTRRLEEGRPAAARIAYESVLALLPRLTPTVEPGALPTLRAAAEIAFILGLSYDESRAVLQHLLPDDAASSKVPWPG